MNPRLAAWEICVRQIFEQVFKNAVVFFHVSSSLMNVKTSPARLGLSTGGNFGWISLVFGTGVCAGGIFLVPGEDLS